MRAYNFPVHGARRWPDRVFRLVLDPRFPQPRCWPIIHAMWFSHFLISSLPKGSSPRFFKAAGPHAIDVNMPAPHRVSDADRAILTNLMVLVRILTQRDRRPSVNWFSRWHIRTSMLPGAFWKLWPAAMPKRWLS